MTSSKRGSFELFVDGVVAGLAAGAPVAGADGVKLGPLDFEEAGDPGPGLEDEEAFAAATSAFFDIAQQYIIPGTSAADL